MTTLSTVKGASAVTLIFAVLSGLGWSQDSSNVTQIKGASNSSNELPFLTASKASTFTVSPEYLLLLQACSKVVKPSCLAPPQPINGEWRLHPDFCKEEHKDCKVPEGTELEMGHELIYDCPAGYKAGGNDAVYCRHNRKWSSIPSCTEMKCHALHSASRHAYCAFSGNIIPCEFPVNPQTKATVACRLGYKQVEVGLLEPLGNELTCNEEGKWEPRPLECVPDCGRVITNQHLLPNNGDLAKIENFPWHANIYFEKNGTKGMKKDFLCSATLVREDLVLTAAHCVYDDTYGTTMDPEKLFVMMGNLFRHYDSPMHDMRIVAKRPVKNVYVHFYYGLLGYYGSDIALVQLKKPFLLTALRLPACLDTVGGIAPQLERGALGRIAGFAKNGSGVSSAILQTATVPYVSNRECRGSANSIEIGLHMAKDKFCAGYGNGSAACRDNGGGGIVFEKNGQWYVIGVSSMGLDFIHQNCRPTCYRQSYIRYTNVSHYTDWILEVLSDEERRKSRRLSMTMTTTTPIPTTTTLPPTTPSSTGRSSCLVPPQPTNGRWRGHPSLCGGNINCSISQGTYLEPGSQLVYSCNEGYKPVEDTDVYCRRGGTWSSLPVCDKIRCSSLNSPSVKVDCKNRTGSWISCDPSVPPQTWATLLCRSGYTENAVITTQAHRVLCTKAGKWEPEPITCIPDCGKAITQQTPFVVNGTTARTGDFPWHASLYLENIAIWSNETKKDFICGATIIQPNLLLTAAHCVYDADTGIERDPKRLFVVTGNVFRDYDFTWHHAVVVKKNKVKNVYRHCNYYGQSGAYASDIALLELEQPFELSKLLLPACLYPDGHDEQILDYGTTGKVAGFGRTTEGQLSSILQTITVPYIPYHDCKTSANAERNKFLISDDKFCAGYTNGSAVCDGDSGGGLVFQIGELWYVMGIVSVGLGVDLDKGEKTCDSHSYTLYTRVSRHMMWIRKIILGLHLKRPLASCDSEASPTSRNRRDSLHRIV